MAKLENIASAVVVTALASVIIGGIYWIAVTYKNMNEMRAGYTNASLCKAQEYRLNNEQIAKK